MCRSSGVDVKRTLLYACSHTGLGVSSKKNKFQFNPETQVKKSGFRLLVDFTQKTVFHHNRILSEKNVLLKLIFR